MNLIILIVCLFVTFCDGSVIDCENGCLDRPIMLGSKATFQLEKYTLETEPLFNGTRFTLKTKAGQAKVVNVNLNDTKSSTSLVSRCDFNNNVFDCSVVKNKVQTTKITQQLKNIKIQKDKCTWMLPLNITLPGKKYATRNTTYWMQVVADGKVVLEKKNYKLSFAASTVGNFMVTVSLIVLSWVIS